MSSELKQWLSERLSAAAISVQISPIVEIGSKKLPAKSSLMIACHSNSLLIVQHARCATSYAFAGLSTGTVKLFSSQLFWAPDRNLEYVLLLSR